MKTKDIENTELYNRMNSDNPPVVVQTSTGGFFISPKIATLAGEGFGKEMEAVVYTSGKNGRLFVSTLGHFFGKTDAGKLRFTEFNV